MQVYITVYDETIRFVIHTTFSMWRHVLSHDSVSDSIHQWLNYMKPTNSCFFPIQSDWELLSNRLAVQIENDGRGNESQCYEAQQRVSPSKT